MGCVVGLLRISLLNDDWLFSLPRPLCEVEVLDEAWVEVGNLSLMTCIRNLVVMARMQYIRDPSLEPVS